MEGSDGRFLDRPHHPLGLSIGPGMIGPGLAMFDAVFRTDGTEDMADKAIFCPFVVLDELNAVIRENGMDFVRHCFDKGFEKACGHKFRRFAIDSGEDNLRRPINSDEEKGFASLVSQFGNVDVKVTDLVCLEPLRLFSINLG